MKEKCCHCNQTSLEIKTLWILWIWLSIKPGALLRLIVSLSLLYQSGWVEVDRRAYQSGCSRLHFCHPALYKIRDSHTNIGNAFSILMTIKIFFLKVIFNFNFGKMKNYSEAIKIKHNMFFFLMRYWQSTIC